MLLSCKAVGGGKTLGAQSTPAKQFAKALTENKYADAAAVWKEKIAGDAALEAEAQACIRTYLSEMERGVFSGEYSAADIAVKRATIDKVCSALGSAPDDYDALCAKIDAALASKAAYQSGCSLEQAGHLADALAEYGKVLAEDPDYADAAARSTAVAAQLKTDALQAAEQALEQDDIKTALNVLRQAQQQLGEDAEIGAKLKTAEAEYAARVKADADAAFSEYAMYALEMIQQEPQDFKDAFAKLYGKEFADETAADFKYRIKRPVVLTFAKRFYENLAATVAEEALTENDILFLLTLLDSTLNYHINFGSENEAEYNAEFEARYRALRDAFFDCFSGIDEADYAAYTAKGENGRLCAGMQWLPTEKQRFLTDKYEGLTKEYKFLSQP